MKADNNYSYKMEVLCGIKFKEEKILYKTAFVFEMYFIKRKLKFEFQFLEHRFQIEEGIRFVFYKTNKALIFICTHRILKFRSGI